MPKRTHKLTPAQRHQISRRLKAGEWPALLAQEFNVSVGSVRSIGRVRGIIVTEEHGVRTQHRRLTWANRVARLRRDGKLTNMFGLS